MGYDNIRKYLGDGWLKNQLSEIERKDIVVEGIPKEMVAQEIAPSVFEKIDELLTKFTKIKNFSQWVREAKSSKTFEDCLFELMALENLLTKTDKIELKPINVLTKLVPEALIEKDNTLLLIEMTNLKSVDGSYKNKVEKLFGKVRNKFKGSQGIHFIGIPKFFKHEGENVVPLKEFSQLQTTIQARFNFRENKAIQAFILTYIFLAYNPKLQKTFVQKRYYIINKPEDKGGLPLSFFDKIFSVDDFMNS